MTAIDLAASLAGTLLVVAAFVALPVAIRAGLQAMLRGAGLDEYRQVPLFAKLVITAGLLLSVPVVGELAERPFGERGLLHLYEILAPEGPWALTFPEFVELRVAAFPGLLAAAGADAFAAPERTSSVLVLAALALVAAAAVLSFAIFAPGRAVIAAAYSVLWAIMIAFVGFYVVIGLAWLVNGMGVFVLLLAIFYYRPPLYFSHK